MVRLIGTETPRTRLDRGSHRRDRAPLCGRRSDRYDEIAAEFVRLKVDVIVTTGPAAQQARRATSVIPIVLPLSGDPWAWAWLRVLRDQAATSPACRSCSPNLPASGSNFCARSSPIFVAWRSWSIPAFAMSCWRRTRFRRWVNRSASKSPCSRSGERRRSCPPLNR